jgi:YD repeat-containing protein
MVGIVTGQGAGLERSSASVLGSRGQIGSSTMGRGGDQVFVNAATGSLVINRRDEFLVGSGPDTAYAQTYDSSGLPQYAWMQSHVRVLGTLNGTLNTAGSTITRGDGDGHNSLYTYDSARGAYVCTEGGGAHDELRNVGGAWTWTDGDSRMTETYTTLSGVPGYQVVSSLSDADGNTQNYLWYSNGTIQRITNSNGEYADFTQTNGLTTQITTRSSGGAATLTRVRYQWDSLRRLSRVTVDLSPGDHSVADGNVYTTDYTYDGSSARITSITQTDGSKLEIAYTQTGNEYRATKLTQTVSAGVTRVTGLHYDLSARTTTIIDALGAATTLKYDAAGNLTQVAHPIPAPGANRPTTVFAYNASGDVISVTEGGRTTTYTYDSKGNVTLKRDAAGNTVSRTYGSKNELLTATEYLVADPDGGGSQQAASPVTTRYAYDARNHLRFEVSSEGRVTEYRYHATTGALVSTLRYTANSYSLANLTPTSTISEAALANWVAAITDKSTVERTDAAYDLRGNVQSVTTYSKTLSDGSGDTGSTFTRTFYAYDQAGNLLSRQVAGQTGVESFVYDGLNRITSSTDATGAVVTFTFLDSATTTRIALAGGSTQVSVFNQAGERISLTESATDITERTSYRYYDALGRLRKDTDAAGNSTYFLYDSIGRKAAEITADGAVTEYGYDSGNRLVKTVSYANRLTDAQINQLGGFSPGGAGGASAGGVSAPTGSTLLANGSFEQSGTFTETPTGRSNVTLPGWTKANPETFEQVNSGAMGVYAADGNYWLDLESIIQSGVVPIGSTLLVNGSFEQTGTYVDTGTGRSSTTMPGWTKANAETFEVVSSGQLGVTASNGGFWLDLDSIPSPGRQAIGSNLLINGSFETSGSYIQIGTGRANSSMPGWTKANPQSFEQVDADGSEIIGYDGAWYLDMDSVPSAAGMVPGVNLIVNGSFEESATSYTETAAGRDNAANLNIPGWVKTNAQGFQQLESGANGVAASDGDYYLDMEVNAGAESRMDMSQTVSGLVAGKQLILKFDYANIAGLVPDGDGGFDNNGALEVYWNGFLLGRVTAQDAAMTTKGFTVTSIAGNNVLRFKEIGVATGDGRGSYLDNVQLYEMVAAPNLIVNGGFEQSAATWTANPTNTGRLNDAAQNIPGWVKANSQGFEQLNSGTGGVTATEGNFFLDMESTGGSTSSRMDISQTIPNMIGGQPLTLKFDFANKAGMVWDVEDYENSGSLEVWWNGIKIAVIGTQEQSLTTKTYSVMSRVGDNVLRFREIGVTDGKGVWLDNVRLHANSGGNMDISQTVTGRTAGEIMQLQFDHASLPNVEDNTFAVYWNGTHVATIDDADINEQMRTKTFFLAAQAGNNTVRFVGLGAIDGVGAALDNVRLHATQLPPNGGNMDISQTVSLSAGKVMLQFEHANRTPGESGGFQVWWNGQLIDTIVETGASMRPKSYVLDAVAGNNIVRFKGTGTVDAAGASLDNVRLFATQAAPTGGNMDISQTVTGLAAGQVLQLQFDHANRTGGPSGFFEVYWNNALVAVVNETGPAMQNKKYNVTAVAGNNILRFRSLGAVDAAGASLDNVRLFALQSGGPDGTPATDPLFGLRPIASASDQWAWRVYDSADQVVQTIDGAGGAETFVYDGASRLVSSRAYAIPFSASAVAGFKTTPPTSAVAPSANTGTDRTARRFYDNEGRLVGTLDGAGGLTQIFHDARGRKIREIAYANAAASSLWASGSFADLLGNVGTSGSDRRVDYVYDRQGMVRFTIDAVGHPTEFVYDSAGLVIRTIQYAGTIGTGSNNTVASVQTAIAAANLASHPANRVSRTVYDGAGRVAFTIDAEGGTTAYGYDQLGNVSKETRYNSVFTATEDQSLLQMQNWAGPRAGDSANRVTRRIFDASGRQVYAVDAEGYVTEQRYDAVGRVKRSIRYAASYSVSDTATKTTLANLIGTPAGAVEKILTYDSAGRLTDATDGAGNITHYVYDGIGRVTEETVGFSTGDASTLKRVYNAAGRVTSETRAHGTTEASATSYFYDAVGNLLTVSDARGFATTRSYDALGHLTGTNITIDPVTSISTSGLYNRFGELVRSTDAQGNSTYHYYDKLGRVVTQRDAEGYLTETGYNIFGETTAVTRRYRKTANEVSTTIVPTSAWDEKDATTAFQYDKLSRLTRTTDAEGKFEQYTLNAFGDRITVVNKLGGTITNTYDKRGLLVSETLPMKSINSLGGIVANSVTNRFVYDARGNRTNRIEAFGLPEQRTTTYVYDKADRLTEIHKDQVSVLNEGNHRSTYLDTPVERFKYDVRGNVIETLDAKGARTLFYYDKLNRKVAEIDPIGVYSACVYDKNGNVTSKKTYAVTVGHPTNPGGTPPPPPAGEFRETTYIYDGLNRLLTSTIANVRTGAWNGSSYVTNVASQSTNYQYDSNGNVTRIFDANGGVTIFVYDKLNRAYGKVDPERWATVWGYDAEGNVTFERRYATPAYNLNATIPNVDAHADDRHTAFTYDRNGNRLSEERYTSYHVLNASGTPVETWGTVKIAYTYNGLGQVTSRTEATGDRIDYEYDTTGRLEKEKRASYVDVFGNSVRPMVTYSYDGLNNLTRTQQGGLTSLGSDRVTRHLYEDGRLVQLTDANGDSRAYAYNITGNLLSETYTRARADGSTAEEAILYTRDQVGRLTSQGLAAWNAGGWWERGDTQDTAFNAFGEVSQRGINSGWQEKFAYDNSGNLWRSNSGDGVWRYYVYDAGGAQTLMIESEGTDLANKTMTEVLNIATQNGATSVGAAYVDGINAKIDVRDKRGMAVATRLPKRQLSETGGIQDLSVTRGYNAFGEVAWETDAKSNVTTYTHNLMGRTVKIERPYVYSTGENGVRTWARPTEYFNYDKSGRLIGTKDANGKISSRTLLAGTGYGGSEGLVTSEYHPHGGVFRSYYDVFGDVRQLTDEIGRSEFRSYDNMSRLTVQTHRGGLTDYYSYDLLGQRITHWNSFLTDANMEVTDYDMQGRVTRQVAFGGDETTTYYYWQWFTTSSMGTYGGWTQVTTYENGRESAEDSDVFGRELYRRDLGGNEFYFSYDRAGRMTKRSGANYWEDLNYNYLNTGLLGSVWKGWGVAQWGSDHDIYKTVYEYDQNGNKTFENYFEDAGHWYDPDYEDPYNALEFYSDYIVHTNASANYDNLNRLQSWYEAGSYTSPTASLWIEYDAVGNVRRTFAEHMPLDANGYATLGTTWRDQWYRYDAMNRVVTADGILLNGAIVRGTQGADYLYDQAGQRVRATRTVRATGTVANPNYDPNLPEDQFNRPTLQRLYDSERREDYSYNAAGALSEVRIAQGGYYDDGNGNPVPTPPPAVGALRGSFSYDLMGRLTRQIDWQGNGTNAGYDRSVWYNAKGQVDFETIVTRQGTDTFTTYYSHYFGTDTAYALGAVTLTTTNNYKNGSFQNGTRTDNTYAWFDGAVQSTIQHTPNTSQSGTVYITDYTYSSAGVLEQIHVRDGRERYVSITNDMNGQAIRRDESDFSSAGEPHEVWYRFNGKQMGYTGNNGTLDTDYQTSIVNRTRASGTGAFRFGGTDPISHSDFDLSLDPINSYEQGGSGGSYTVRGGDTLGGIAAQLWGDASLWYKLAEANGIAGAGALSEGQRLIIPAGVTKSTHNASTFQPYDPRDAIGDTSPSSPQPQRRKNKCGTFGTILLVAIAVAVTVLTYGALTGPTTTFMGTIWAGAAAGAAGSAASQAVGVATGIQDEFSWRGVAMGALGGAIGSALAPAFAGSHAFVRGALRGAAGSAITQGVGVATGLQDKFDWAGVAAAAVGGGVSEWANFRYPKSNKYVRQAVSSSASAIAGAAARTVRDGSNFGDNLFNELPNVIGQTIGNALADYVSSRYSAAVANARARKATDTGSAMAGPGLGNGAAGEPIPGKHGGKVGGAYSWLADNALDPDFATAFDDFIGRNGVEDYVNRLIKATASRGAPYDRQSEAALGHLQAVAASGSESAAQVHARFLNWLNYESPAARSVANLRLEAWGVSKPLSAPTLPASRSENGGVASFLWGIIGGDWTANDTSGAATAGRFVGSLIPVYSDILNISASIYGIYKGRKGAWIDLAFNAVGIIPVIGDGIKGLKYADEGLDLMRNGDGAVAFLSRGDETLGFVGQGSGNRLLTDGGGQRLLSDGSDRGVYFFDDEILPYVHKPDATLGIDGKAQFFMPGSDGARVTDPATAYLYSGGAPALERGLMNGSPVFGVDFPLSGMSPRLPTTADAGGFENFLEGGHTALRRSDGSGYVVNTTREFVIPGGGAMPQGAVLFRIAPDGGRVPIRRW